MAGKVIEPEEIVVNRDATPIEAEAVPRQRSRRPRHLPRSTRPSGPRWPSSSRVPRSPEHGDRPDDYVRSRFTGEQLTYALAELERAAEASLKAAA